MRRLVLAVVLLAAVGQSPLCDGATPEDVLGWGGTEWGMDTEQIDTVLAGRLCKLAERQHYSSREAYADWSIPDYELLGEPFEVCFLMGSDSRCLEGVVLDVADTVPAERHLTLYDELEVLLTDQYGQPESRGEPDDEEVVAKHVEWVFPSTTIRLGHLSLPLTETSWLTVVYSMTDTEETDDSVEKPRYSLDDAAEEERSIVAEIVSGSGASGSRLTIPGLPVDDAPPCAATIQDFGGVWSCGMEFPNDHIPITNNQTRLFGAGSIHRFSGVVRFDDSSLPVFVGEGGEANRLTFVLVSGGRYVYVRGRGKVVFPDGRTLRLPPENEASEPSSSMQE